MMRNKDAASRCLQLFQTAASFPTVMHGSRGTGSPAQHSLTPCEAEKAWQSFIQGSFGSSICNFGRWPLAGFQACDPGSRCRRVSRLHKALDRSCWNFQDQVERGFLPLQVRAATRYLFLLQDLVPCLSEFE